MTCPLIIVSPNPVSLFYLPLYSYSVGSMSVECRVFSVASCMYALGGIDRVLLYVGSNKSSEETFNMIVMLPSEVRQNYSCEIIGVLAVIW